MSPEWRDGVVHVSKHWESRILHRASGRSSASSTKSCESGEEGWRADRSPWYPFMAGMALELGFEE